MKRLISVILVIFMLVVLMGCAKIEDDNVEFQTDRIKNLGFTVLEHAGRTTDVDYYVVYDNDTNVVYFLSFTYSGGVTFSPRYDENGEIMIYGG